MSAYQIIDEPQATIYSKLVVDPVVILFASILLPIFITLPFYGRFWIPLVWAVLNSFLLGSPTRIKETVIAVLGCILLFLFYGSMLYLANVDPAMTKLVAPYYQIVNQGLMFFILYLIVFYQSAPYAINQYLKQ